MLKTKQTVVYKYLIYSRFFLTLVTLVFFCIPRFEFVYGADSFFQKNSEGMIRNFKIKDLPLAEFVREYSHISGKRIEVGGPWDQVLKGTVTLLVPHPISQETLDELFHQVLDDLGFAAIDTPGKSAWVIAHLRDARDSVIPVYDSKQFPDSWRLMTVVHQMKFLDADDLARTLRNFMPVSSRIIPATRTQLLITTVGTKTKEALELANLLDTEEAAKVAKNMTLPKKAQTCGNKEQKIEKLVVEKLEIQGTSSFENLLGNSAGNSVNTAGGSK